MIKKIKLTEKLVANLIKSDLSTIHHYNIPKLIKKSIQELQGISSAVIYDGQISDSEIDLIKNWLQKNDEYLVDYPLVDLRNLFNNILSDGIVTTDERKNLLEFLETIAASPNAKPTVEGIFVDNPTIIFRNKNFLFTGELVYGSRSKAQSKVVELGGLCQKGLNMQTDYLVVGSQGSEDYKYSRFGTKIESAIKYNREKGANIFIVKENDFVQAIITVSSS
ncbi:MAG: BRCT domain-containing protein [Bacteroidetes bacterium]|nr:BRCT domain-containing protein [Bacteroidota bacterium]